MSEPGLAIYSGRTLHARYQPFEHSFKYRIAPFLFEADALERSASDLSYFSLNKLNLFSLWFKDFGARDGSDPRIWARETFAGAGIDLAGGGLRLLALPRLVGYAFNPISVWFGLGPDGDPRGVIYEVHNTFSQAHAYVAPLEPSGKHEHASPKAFHVSPFFPVAGDYDFTLIPPGARFDLAIRKSMNGAPALLATMSLKRQPITDRALLAQALKTPFMTLGVTAAIHWQALKLWLKGARYHSPPEPPAEPSLARPRR